MNDNAILFQKRLSLHARIDPLQFHAFHLEARHFFCMTLHELVDAALEVVLNISLVSTAHSETQKRYQLPEQGKPFFGFFRIG